MLHEESRRKTFLRIGMYCFISFYTSRANNERLSKNKKKNKEMKRRYSILNDKWAIASLWLAALAMFGFYLMTSPSKIIIPKNNPDAPTYRQGSGVR